MKHQGWRDRHQGHELARPPNLQAYEAAKQVLAELRSLNTEHSLHLADALLVVRDEEGKVTIDSGKDAVVSGAAEGAFWGGLIGLLLLSAADELRLRSALDPQPATVGEPSA